MTATAADRADGPAADRAGGPPPASLLDRLADAVGATASEPAVRVSGRVTDIRPSAFAVAGLSRFVRLGERVGCPVDGRMVAGEVVRIDAGTAVVKPYDTDVEIGIGSVVERLGPLALHPDPSWKGRLIDVFARPIDGDGPLAAGSVGRPLRAAPPPAVHRDRVDQPVRTGVRVIDLFTPICAGQRIGVFAGSGVGKTTLLSMLAAAAEFDTIVVALVGERGREVREFVEEALSRHRDRSVAVVSTADESPMRRRLAPVTAMAIAEYFRDRGEKVLLILDSATRFAHAARDVALAAGEPPVSRGYPPSVFTELPMLLERAGPGAKGAGSITAVISVLVDGDDHNDPIADAIRGILDGHIVLERSIAEAGRYPAVDVLKSISRLSHKARSPDELKLAGRLRGLVSRYEDTRDLRMMGGYTPGADTDLDQAVALVPKIYEALIQGPADPVSQDAYRELAAALT
ncbi:flagellar protein export ATPase FliI [Chthonobacter rhizosphaerae]|uniref:flagellar protein export ATPase FliI n=1 Tax=Chthonobacter rhizosphaerae TaxID=2735553 RepID=UPI0015EE4AC1